MATHSSIILFVALGVVICLGRIGALTEHEVGIDGMRCDSCGMECSNMCGSRSFKLCCLNYVKKRSTDAVVGAGVGELDGGGGQRAGAVSAGRQAITKGGLDRTGGARLRKLFGMGENIGGGGVYLSDPQWILVSSPIRQVGSGGGHDQQEAEEGIMRQVYSRMI